MSGTRGGPLLRAAAIAAAYAASGAQVLSAAVAATPIAVADQALLQDVGEPAISPDGAWVAYSVSIAEPKTDRHQSDVWLASFDGRRVFPVANTSDDESTPRWSPDGRMIGFLSSRNDAYEADQVWLLGLGGGDAQRLTDFPGGVEEFAWSPDGRRLALIVTDADPDAVKNGEDKPPKPLVIDRYYFKEDVSGYLRHFRKHLYVFDVESRRAELIAPGDFDELHPSWSPDGKSIAFLSKREGADADRHETFGLYVVEPRANAPLRKLADFQGESGDAAWLGAPQWSPDGKHIAYGVAGDPKLIYYSTHRIAIVDVSAEGKAATPRLLTKGIDRNVERPRWSADGKSLIFILEDDRNQHLVRLPAAGGSVTQLLGGERTVYSFDVAAGGRIVVAETTATRPLEISAVERGAVRTISKHNDAWLAQRRLASYELVRARSRDGTEVSGFIVKPPDYVPGRKYPTILRVHGGPVSQFANEFEFEWQLFAAHGYVVVAANPRGSSGRGEEYAKAIYADWGRRDAQDVLAIVDYAIAQGIADPERLGIGGWSYGGMLTNYVIAQDRRFKAAVSGASTSNAIAGYGTDMYTVAYEQELGVPWKNFDVYQRVSFPFLTADRITTPTLFMCGERDFNVPLLNSEQMYQALRSLGVPTQLVIYPGEFHGLRRQSFLQDRLERHLAWYGKYLLEDRGGSAR